MENEIDTAVGVEDVRTGRAQQDASQARSALSRMSESRRAVMSRTLGGTSGAFRSAHGRLNSVSSTYRYITAIAVRFWLVVLLYALTSSY